MRDLISTRGPGASPRRQGRWLLLTLLSVVVAGPLSAGDLQSLIVGFARTTRRESHQESVKGTVYYQAPSQILVRVSDPLNQWLEFKGETLVIYYPDDQKAFRIQSQYPFTLPFFQAFVGVVKEGFGLAEIGYTLSRNDIRAETLVTIWSPPEKARKVLGNVSVGLVEDRIAFSEMQNAKGKRIARATYTDYFQYQDRFFPLTVSSTQWLGKDPTFEKVSYADPQFDVELPEEVVGFQVPESVEVKDVKW